MKFWKFLGDCLDWLGKNLSRIKTLGVIILIIFFVLSVCNNGCKRAEISEMVERITGLNVENDILQRDVKARDSLIIKKEMRIREIQDSLKISEAATMRLKVDYGHLNKKYNEIAERLIGISTDSSYRFLTLEAYPYEGQLKYPFNEPQVRGIHMTYVQKIELEGLNMNLTSQIKEFEKQLSFKDTVYAETSKILAMTKASRGDLDKVIDNQGQIITDQAKQIKKETNRKKFWRIATGVVTAIGIGLAL